MASSAPGVLPSACLPGPWGVIAARGRAAGGRGARDWPQQPPGHEHGGRASRTPGHPFSGAEASPWPPQAPLGLIKQSVTQVHEGANMLQNTRKLLYIDHQRLISAIKLMQ